MSLSLIGLNFRTAPLDLRERLALNESECRKFLPALTKNSNTREALVLSTCSRVEILLEGDGQRALSAIINFLSDAKNIAPERFSDYLYRFSDRDAVHHLFRVAASLDSMMIGETQILRQVKNAYQTASESGAVHSALHKLLQASFHAAKRVHSETRISSNAASLSRAAVDLAGQTLGGLKGKTALLVGAGVMAKLGAKHLTASGVSKLFVVNRTYSSATILAAEFSGEPVTLENLPVVLPLADLVICSTAAEDYLITPEMVRESQEARSYRPVLIVDLSVPRNISPQIDDEERNVFLRSVDNLEKMGAKTSINQQKQISRAEAIIEEEVAEFWQAFKTLGFGTQLGRIREMMQENARLEIRRRRKKLGTLTAEQETAIESLIISVVNQAAHPILCGLRQSHEYWAVEFAEAFCRHLADYRSPEKQGSLS